MIGEAALAVALIPDQLVIPGFMESASIIIGGVTGAMLATRKGFDPVGVLLIAYCTAVGGGLVRDILIQAGVPAVLQHPSYQFYATLGAVVGLFFAKGAARYTATYDFFNVIMLGVWVLLACDLAMAKGLDFVPTVFMGTIAAVAGGLLRDVLCHDVAELLQPGVMYSVAAFLSATIYTSLMWIQVTPLTAQLTALIVASSVRFAAITFQVQTPMPYDVSEHLAQRWRQYRGRRSTASA